MRPFPPRLFSSDAFVLQVPRLWSDVDHSLVKYRLSTIPRRCTPLSIARVVALQPFPETWNIQYD
jgi:hypothetical protein